jgi:hypothetical protein
MAVSLKSAPVKAAPGPHRRLLELQRRIFQSLQAEADRLLGDTPAPIRRYQQAYERVFRRLRRTRPRAVSKAQLIEAIRAADVTFIGDYHTFRQSQRTALRLMRDAVRPGELWYVGLEFIPSRHQPLLDRFQEGKLAVGEFLSQIHYQEQWGFPWQHYEPIFQWARSHEVRLIALNRPRELAVSSATLRRVRDDADLAERDRWAAGLITDLMSDAADSAPGAGPGARPRMLVLYGELHVASCHLPAALERVSRAFRGRVLRSVSVHQNNDELYWELTRKRGQLHADAIRLDPRTYFVPSATPWARLQSLIAWAEERSSSLSPDGRDPAETRDSENEWELEPDILSTMQTYGRTVADFLGIAPAPYESVTLQTIGEADFVDWLGREGHFTPAELRLLRELVTAGQPVFIPRSQIAYLGSGSHNGAAELASVHLLRHHTRCQDIFVARRDDWFRLVLEAGFGFFGSLLLNPRRKCDLARDHAQRVRELQAARRLDARERRELAARRLTLAMLRRRAGGVPALDATMRDRRSSVTACMAARYAGQILGKRLHQAFFTGIVTADEIRALLLTPARRSHPADAYERRHGALAAMISAAPLLTSKRETF